MRAWVDHFDTWAHDLVKRLDAQPDPKEPTAQVTPQDIPLALRIGANLLEAAADVRRGLMRGDSRRQWRSCGILRTRICRTTSRR